MLLIVALAGCYGAEPHDGPCLVQPGAYELTVQPGAGGDVCTARNLTPSRVTVYVEDGPVLCGPVESVTATTRNGAEIVETVVADLDDEGALGGELTIEVAGDVCTYDLVPEPAP